MVPTARMKSPMSSGSHLGPVLRGTREEWEGFLLIPTGPEGPGRGSINVYMYFTLRLEYPTLYWTVDHRLAFSLANLEAWPNWEPDHSPRCKFQKFWPVGTTLRHERTKELWEIAQSGYLINLSLQSKPQVLSELNFLASRLTQGSAWFEGSQNKALPCASVIQHTISSTPPSRETSISSPKSVTHDPRVQPPS